MSVAKNTMTAIVAGDGVTLVLQDLQIFDTAVLTESLA